MASAQTQKYNETVLSSLEEGDLVEFPRGLYSHWAVYIGDNTVVHVTGVNDEGIKQQTNVTQSFSCCGKIYDKAIVRKDNFFEVCGKDKAKRNNSLDKKKNPASRHEIVKNALSRLNEVGYNLLWKNCEHFATWCRYGEASSDQSDFLVKTGVAAGIVAGVVASVGVGVAASAGASHVINKKSH